MLMHLKLAINFFNFGLSGYKEIYSICPRIFLDLKLHDIPNTVKNGIKAIKNLSLFLQQYIYLVEEMMISSIKDKGKTKILGVSVLTSLNSNQTKKYYNQKQISSLVKKFSKVANKNGLDGVVCSPKEIEYIRKEVGKNFIIITPGIRIDNKVRSDDQKRIETPKKAIDLGANYLVIGRPITESKNPLKVLKEINKSLL